MTTFGGAPSGYPVTVTFDENQQINRLWGIPFVGYAVRAILLIPHFIVLWVLELLIALSFLVSWIPVLFTGRQAQVLSELFVATYRYQTRVLGWLFLLAGPYPPILPASSPYPINLEAPIDGTINRLWGIPFLGIWVRGLAIIPHAFLLIILYFPIVLISLVIWIPILINGRMPRIGYTLYGGFLRLYARTGLWVLLTPVPYPPLGIS